jgi:hypothetical protein
VIGTTLGFQSSASPFHIDQLGKRNEALLKHDLSALGGIFDKLT